MLFPPYNGFALAPAGINDEQRREELSRGLLLKSGDKTFHLRPGVPYAEEFPRFLEFYRERAVRAGVHALQLDTGARKDAPSQPGRVLGVFNDGRPFVHLGPIEPEFIAMLRLRKLHSVWLRFNLNRNALEWRVQAERVMGAPAKEPLQPMWGEGVFGNIFNMQLSRRGLGRLAAAGTAAYFKDNRTIQLVNTLSSALETNDASAWIPFDPFEKLVLLGKIEGIFETERIKSFNREEFRDQIAMETGYFLDQGIRNDPELWDYFKDQFARFLGKEWTKSMPGIEKLMLQEFNSLVGHKDRITEDFLHERQHMPPKVGSMAWRRAKDSWREMDVIEAHLHPVLSGGLRSRRQGVVTLNYERDNPLYNDYFLPQFLPAACNSFGLQQAVTREGISWKGLRRIHYLLSLARDTKQTLETARVGFTGYLLDGHPLEKLPVDPGDLRSISGMITKLQDILDNALLSVDGEFQEEVTEEQKRAVQRLELPDTQQDLLIQYAQEFLKAHEGILRQNLNELLESLADPARWDIALYPGLPEKRPAFNEVQRQFLNRMPGDLLMGIFKPKFEHASFRAELTAKLDKEKFEPPIVLSDEAKSFLEAIRFNPDWAKQVRLTEVEDLSAGRVLNPGRFLYRLKIGLDEKTLTLSYAGHAAKPEGRLQIQPASMDKDQLLREEQMQAVQELFEAWRFAHPERETVYQAAHIWRLLEENGFDPEGLYTELYIRNFVLNDSAKIKSGLLDAIRSVPQTFATPAEAAKAHNLNVAEVQMAFHHSGAGGIAKGESSKEQVLMKIQFEKNIRSGDLAALEKYSDDLIRRAEKFILYEIDARMKSEKDVKRASHSSGITNILFHLVQNAVDAVASRGTGKVAVGISVLERAMIIRVIDQGAPLPFNGRVYHGSEIHSLFREKGVYKRGLSSPVQGGRGQGLQFSFQSLAQIPGASLEWMETPGGGTTAVLKAPFEVPLTAKDIESIPEKDPLKRVEMEMRRWELRQEQVNRVEGAKKLWGLLKENGLPPGKYYTDMYLELFVKHAGIEGLHWTDIKRAIENVTRSGWSLQLAASNFRILNESEIKLAMRPPGIYTHRPDKAVAANLSRRFGVSQQIANAALQQDLMSPEEWIVLNEGFTATGTRVLHLSADYDPISDALVLRSDRSITMPRIPGTVKFKAPAGGGIGTRQLLLNVLSSVSMRPQPALDLNPSTKMPPGISDFMLSDKAWDAGRLGFWELRRLNLSEEEKQLLKTVQAMVQSGQQAELVQFLADWVELPEKHELKLRLAGSIVAAQHVFTMAQTNALSGLDVVLEDLNMQRQGEGSVQGLLPDGRKMPSPDVSAYEHLMKKFRSMDMDSVRINYLLDTLARLRVGVLTRQEEDQLPGLLLAQQDGKIPLQESSRAAVELIYLTRKTPDFHKVIVRAILADRVSRILAKAFRRDSMPAALPQETRELAAQLLTKLVPADLAGVQRNLKVLQRLGLFDVAHLRPLLEYPRAWVRAEVVSMLHRKPHVISSPESIFELIEILEKKEQGDAGLETLIRTHINRFTLKDLKELSQKLGEAGMQQKVAHYCQPELFLALIDAIVEDLTEGNNSGGENLRLVRLLGWVLSGVDTGIKEKILMHVSRTTPGADLQQFAAREVAKLHSAIAAVEATQEMEASL